MLLQRGRNRPVAAAHWPVWKPLPCGHVIGRQEKAMSNNPKKPSPHLYLVTRDGVRVAADRVPAVEAPETELDVTFVGLSDAEQRAALASFPGGRRFRLKPVG
jgi:hypothetical protein